MLVLCSRSVQCYVLQSIAHENIARNIARNIAHNIAHIKHSTCAMFVLCFGVLCFVCYVLVLCFENIAQNIAQNIAKT